MTKINYYMENKKIKVIVAHPGKQHSFRVAKALKEAGLLYKYATTVYDKDGSLLMRCIKAFLNKNNRQRAQKHKCISLSDDDVVQFCELESLILLGIIRIDFTHKLSNWYSSYVSRKFQRKLADYILSHHINIVISYDTNSSVLFSILSEQAPSVVRVMDNAHPNRHYLYHDYHRKWDCCGDFSKTLEVCGYLTNEKIAIKLGEEIKMAQYHIVASSYSAKALDYESIAPQRIFKIPYGVDPDKFLKCSRVYSREKLNVLFIGEVNQRKGIAQILEAAKIINSKDISFNVVGRGLDLCNELYRPYDKYVHFYGHVSYGELLRQLRVNHLFVFPTMVWTCYFGSDGGRSSRHNYT